MSDGPEAALVLLDRVLRAPTNHDAERCLTPSLAEPTAWLTDRTRARFIIYRKLVHNRLHETITSFMPRTHARMGAERMHLWIDRVFAEQGATSRLLREVPEAFATWVAPRWRTDERPAYLADLARFEVARVALRTASDSQPLVHERPFALDACLAFAPALRVLAFDHAVHRLPFDKNDRTDPARVPTHVLLYRDGSHALHLLELQAFTHALTLALMQPTTTVETALRAACDQTNVPLNDERLAVAAAFLGDLGQRGVLLGAI